MDDLTILDALQIAKAAEQRTADLYAEAAGQTPNPLARALFSELADFERHHYNRLVSLEKSLRAENGFITYEGRTLDLPTSGGVEAIDEPDEKSAMAVVTMAIDVERKAEERYKRLAEQTSNPDGRAMFERLAAEEHDHYLLLSEAYWSLNDRGVWQVPRQHGLDTRGV
jgi:rubrerythrin